MKKILNYYHERYEFKIILSCALFFVPIFNWTLIGILWTTDLFFYCKNASSRPSGTVLLIITVIIGLLTLIGSVLAVINITRK